MVLHRVVSHLKDGFLAFQLLAIVPSRSHRTCMGDVVCFHFLEQKRRNVEDENGKELCYRKDPYKSRPGCLCHQTTEEPNKPSKRTYLSDHTITPSNKYPDWIYLNASCVQGSVRVCTCMYVCVVIKFNKCSCVYSTL